MNKVKDSERQFMPIKPSGNTSGSEIAATEFLQHIKPIKIRNDWVKLVGGLAVHGKTEGDVDIIIEPITGELLENITKFRLYRGLPDEFSDRLAFLPQGKWKGPFTDFISLGDLVFVPKTEFQRIEMQLRSAPEEIKAQAEKSQELNVLSIERMFYPMKPARGAYENQHQNIESFIELFQGKSFPRLISKKFDGNTFIFLKRADRVTVYSDDGLENTDNLPILTQKVLKFNQQSLIFLAEVELWVDGIHYPREAVRTALTTKFKEWNRFLTANIFELLYVNGRDLHRFPAMKRHSIAKEVFQSLPSTDEVPKPGFNFVPQRVARDVAQLKSQTEYLSKLPGSEGVVVKKGDYSLSGQASLEQAVKYHKAAWVYAVVLERIETAAEGIFVYRYGLPHDAAIGLDPPTPVHGGKAEEKTSENGILSIGKTFNTTLEAKVGDILQIEFETLNFVQDNDKSQYDISLWVPTVISAPPKPGGGKPHTTFEALQRAKDASILRRKWIAGGETFYDKRKISKKDVEEQFQAQDPYLDYPPHGKKMIVMRHAHFRGKSVHFDNRRELIPGKRLIGWTENVQIEDTIEGDVETLEQAAEICKGYSMSTGNKYLNPLKEGDKIVVEEKAPEPFSWASYSGVVAPGGVGATKEKEGVLYIIDKGKTEWGTMKSHFHEYFDSEGKIFNGRYIVRQLKDVWGITKFKTVWFAWYANDPMPYVLSKRAVDKEWMPPDGQSALPKVIRDAIPSEYEYWRESGIKARETRDKLIADKVITNENLRFNASGEIEVIEAVTPLPPYTGVKNCPSEVTDEGAPTLSFRLAYRSWKGQQVIRYGRKGRDWIIMIPDNGITLFHCNRSPILEDSVSATMEVVDDEFYDFEGEIPADHPVNPLKDIPIQQIILDRGEATIFENRVDFKKIEFGGNKLNGLWVFKKEDGDIWTVTKSSPPLTSPRIRGDKGGMPIYVPQKTSVRFEVDIDNPNYAEVLAWISDRKNAIFVEPKLVGLRTIATKDNIYLEGNPTNQAKRFPELTSELSKLDEKAPGVVFDGELVESTLHLFSVLKIDSQDLRDETEEIRFEKLEQLDIGAPPTPRMRGAKGGWIQKIPYAKIEKNFSQEDWQKAFGIAFDAENSEGAMLKDALATANQKWNNNWAKVKLVRYYTAEILGKTRVDDPDRETWVYELGFKNQNGETAPLGTSMTSGIKLKIGDYAIVSLPASGVWETPVIKGKSEKQDADEFIPKGKFEAVTPLPPYTGVKNCPHESGTPLWVECEEMEAELDAGVYCTRLREIVDRSLEIYTTDWVYKGEQDYAYSIWERAREQAVSCLPSMSRETDTIEFGEIQAGETGTVSTWISNGAAEEGDDLEVEISQWGSGTVFSVSESAFTVLAGETYNFEFYAESESAGKRQAAFLVTTNDPDNSAFWYFCMAEIVGI